MNGKLIVIDGADGCGKATQTKKLIERLINEEYSIETLDFPQYENNFFGHLVGCFLRGDFGNPSKMNPYLSSVLYAADRFESSKKIKNWLLEDKIVILDRYVSANQIHQGSKIKDGRERKNFLNWLDKIEHGVFDIPRPDLIIYLDVSFETSQKLMKGRGELDKNESNEGYQIKCREESLHLVSEINNWSSIVCEEDGKLLSIDKIHKKIWEAVENVL